MLNNCTFMGRFTADPELRTTPNGISVCSFSIAVQRPRIKDTETQADFINCVAWRGSAETIAKFFRKGNRIVVNGRMQTRSVKNEESNTSRTYTELLVNEWDFVDYKSDNNSAYTNNTETHMESQPIDNTNESDDDYPF